jgi:putative hydrolase
MLHNFHSHSTLSDGCFSPMELMRRFDAGGYSTLAVTDHAAAGGLGRIIAETLRDAELANQYFEIDVLVGVEITHAPPEKIAALARQAREEGAQIVVVHGETITEPTPEGTNAAAASCPDVDILAHPGLITREVALLAIENGVLLEISARKGHCLTNGHVARVALETGADLIFGTDAHGPDGILSREMRDRVLAGAGLSEEQIRMAGETAPRRLRERYLR